ncbi:MAG: GGDEF domain-containing protein [Gammaproteobacteria bacterium]|nr:GGDEF domain-containing protein [Gammaproteobacteria bacterium]
MTERARKQPDNPRSDTDAATRMHRGAWFFSLLILAMVGAMLAWNAHVRDREFATYQQRLMESSVNGTAAELGVFIGELRRSVHLFVDTERAQLDRLAADPADEQTLEKLNAAVRKHFPEAFAFTLADNEGNPLLDDFDGLVGEICINDMQTFATHREHSKVYIHPNPTAYHFDIMVDREHNGGSAGIFFVSFTTDILSRTLKHGEVPGHKLLLLKQDVPGLIEVTSDGVRIKLQREFKLSAREIARIGYTAPISGTSWDLVDLPDPDLYTSMRDNILRESVLIVLAFLTINGAMLWMLHRSQAKRRTLEHLYHHDPVTGLPNSHLFLERFAHMTHPGP